MTTQTIALHPDTRMRLLIDLMATNQIQCRLGELHDIIDETEDLIGNIEINFDGINARLEQLRKSKT